MALLLGKNKTAASQTFQRKFYGKIYEARTSDWPGKFHFSVRFAGGKEHGYLHVVLPVGDLKISDELYITIEKKAV